MLIPASGLDASLAVAGLASRGVAAAVDLAMPIAIVALFGAALPEPRGWAPDLLGARGGLLLALTVVLPAIGEAGWGRSLGKGLVGLRVLRVDGRPLDGASAWIRSLLRIVDLLPLPYGIGVVSALTSPLGQRLGDRAAGTVVVTRLGVSLEARSHLHAFGGQLPGPAWPPPPGTDPSEPVVPLTAAELALARRFLARRTSLDRTTRAGIASLLAARLRGRHPAYAALPDEVVLEQIVAGRYREARRRLGRT